MSIYRAVSTESDRSTGEGGGGWRRAADIDADGDRGVFSAEDGGRKPGGRSRHNKGQLHR